MGGERGMSVTTGGGPVNQRAERKLVRAVVGGGTFVTAVPPAPGERVEMSTPLKATVRDRTSRPWRRRALMNQGTKLRSRYPHALDCSTGRPDMKLLPLRVLQEAGIAALRQVKAADLQYAGPEVLEVLEAPLGDLLERTGLGVRPDDLLIASSAHQSMMLPLDATPRIS